MILRVGRRTSPPSRYEIRVPSAPAQHRKILMISPRDFRFAILGEIIKRVSKENVRKDEKYE